MFAAKYPDLANFIGSWFPDADFEELDDIQVAERFVSITAPENRVRVVDQGRRVLQLEELPWKEISAEANRYFRDEDEARSWLSEVLDALGRAEKP